MFCLQLNDSAHRNSGAVLMVVNRRNLAPNQWADERCPEYRCGKPTAGIHREAGWRRYSTV